MEQLLTIVMTTILVIVVVEKVIFLIIVTHQHMLRVINYIDNIKNYFIKFHI
jgi:hypothetical protein